MSVCIRSRCFYIINIYVFTKLCIIVCIYPLSRIHNIGLISASFELDSRECKCLEYLFIFLRYSSETPTFYQNYLAMRNTADVTDGKSIAV
jgi:hypothetical protein